jgi:catalase
LRVRPESFADHYSQARQFYISQMDIEQRHIVDALIFELSKVVRPDIRSRVVSHLLNIDEGLAQEVARGLRLKEIPEPAQAARPTRRDLKASAPLSIIRNGPGNFKGRKIGVLVTDGADVDLFKALEEAARAEGAVIEVIAPTIGGVQASDGSWVEAAQNIVGGPSVLYDAVAILTSADGVGVLLKESTARDFVADALAHFKFIAYSSSAMPLLEKSGFNGALEEACISLDDTSDPGKFVTACRSLRFWSRTREEGLTGAV